MLLRIFLGAVAIGAAGLARARAADAEQRIPVHHAEQRLVSSVGWNDWRYLAFPTLLDLSDDVLVAFKRGRSHANDPGATLEMFRLDGRTGRVSDRRVLAAMEGTYLQVGEWVRFPNGDIANFIDVRQGTTGVDRLGLRVVRSTDGGRSFGAVERVGEIDGLEYGYAFEARSEGATTWMLAMTVPRSPAGSSNPPGRPPIGSVDVVRTENNGRTWRFVRSLSKEFGDLPLNESTFLRHGDGYLVATRGYDERARLHLTDRNFKVRRQLNLTATYPFITGFVARPRLFVREGRVYLLGRNTTQATPPPGWRPTTREPVYRSAPKLCLFRLDPDAPAVTSYAVLDNAEVARVTDGYYAMPYFRESEGRTLVSVVTYKGLDGQPPQIIRLEYRWDEIN